MTVAPLNPPYVAARWHGGTQTPKLIVMHGTASPCKPGGAREIAHFFATEDNKTSAHYVRDPFETIQCVGDHTVAYHCGHNQDSIGYELCDPQAGDGSRWADKPHGLMLAGAAEDVARLCLTYGIPAVKIGPAELLKGKRGICGHVDMTNAFHQSTHTDPGSSFPWSKFIEQVKAEIVRLKEGIVVASKPTPPDSVVRIDNAWTAHREYAPRADLEALIDHGTQPYAAAAKACRDACDDAVAAFLKAVDRA